MKIETFRNQELNPKLKATMTTMALTISMKRKGVKKRRLKIDDGVDLDDEYK